MKKTKLKKEVKNLLKELPEDSEWEDLMYKIYVRQSIEEGLNDYNENNMVSHEKIKRKFRLTK